LFLTSSLLSALLLPFSVTAAHSWCHSIRSSSTPPLAALVVLNNCCVALLVWDAMATPRVWM
jgi:hypothetical protein